MAGQEKLGSLVDAGMAAVPAKPTQSAQVSGRRGGGGGMPVQDRLKAAAAIAVILASGAGLAAYYGAFSKPAKSLPTAPVAPPDAPAPSPEEKKAIEDQQLDVEEMIKTGEAEKAGSG